VAELRAGNPTLTQKEVADLLEVAERTVRKYWHEDDGEAQERLLGDATGSKPEAATRGGP
jgi:predicted transcriptional regulator